MVDARTAARWGVHTAREITRDPAPLENCALGGRSGTFLYGSTASYGQSAREARRRLDHRSDDHSPRRAGAYELTARCPGAAGTALFQVETLHDEDDPKSAAPDVDHEGLRAALQRFAERSAKKHGCGAVEGV
ncbi:hypothetical protein SCALM49S_02795 [Streptomyces californicus]